MVPEFLLKLGLHSSSPEVEKVPLWLCTSAAHWSSPMALEARPWRFGTEVAMTLAITLPVIGRSYSHGHWKFVDLPMAWWFSWCCVSLPEGISTGKKLRGDSSGALKSWKISICFQRCFQTNDGSHVNRIMFRAGSAQPWGTHQRLFNHMFPIERVVHPHV